MAQHTRRDRGWRGGRWLCSSCLAGSPADGASLSFTTERRLALKGSPDVQGDPSRDFRAEVADSHDSRGFFRLGLCAWLAWRRDTLISERG